MLAECLTINWPKFVETIRGNQRFLLTSHIRPDCDALGSELGMARVLESLDDARNAILVAPEIDDAVTLFVATAPMASPPAASSRARLSSAACSGSRIGGSGFPRGQENCFPGPGLSPRKSRKAGATTMIDR